MRVVCLIIIALSLSACGFHLREAARLPAGMQRVHLEIADPFSPLARDLGKALQRSGATIEGTAAEGSATLRVPVNSLATEILSVGETARVREFVVRYKVEFDVLGVDGQVLIPAQSLDLSRDFAFDDTQALGTAGEEEILRKELQREMVQAMLRRIEAVGRAQ